MQIGIDATCWWNQRGFGRYTRLLLGALMAEPRDHQLVLFVDRKPAPEMVGPNVRVVQVKTRATVVESAQADSNRSLSDLLIFRRAVAAERLDVMYFPAVYSWYPTGGKAPVVVTFHDAIAERFPSLVMPTFRGRLFWTLKVWLAKRVSTFITTVSEAARNDIVKHLGVSKDRIRVFLEAADARFKPIDDPMLRTETRRRLGLNLDRRLILYVGGLAPHKNLGRLIDAYAQALASPAMADVDLVLAGDPKGDGFLSNYDELVARVKGDPALEGRVWFTGFVSDADLVTLYSDALVVAMPALAEGFGLPAAEAIACGTPVIATKDGAVAEVVGAAGLFFDPHDVTDMARTILQAASDKSLLERLRAACLPRAAELSWSRSAAGLLTLLEAVATGRIPPL